MKRLSKMIFFCVFIVLLFPQPGDTCTTFSIESDGRHVIGKNYDWHLERGLLIINKRSVSKNAIESLEKDPGPYAKWISRYGSLTFNQYGREVPMGGINEAGLVVEIMSLGTTRYPQPDSRSAINPLQWIQYQLDNFSSVEEVIASDKYLRVYSSEESGVHYLVADKAGNCASIEFIDGKFVYHTKETMPVRVLANNTYERSIKHLKAHKGFGGREQIPNGYSSLDRFTRAAEMLLAYNQKNPKPPVDYAFDILANVANPSASWGTKWSIVYEIKNSMVLFRTFSNKKLRYISLKELDFSCKKPVRVFDMNLDVSGDITQSLSNYTQQANLDLIKHSFKKTHSLSVIADDELLEFSKYPESTNCVK
ncbi:linear amide C-N hydrolase [Thermodesulfobacteriota bacterium]